jgi:hypothetical protein
MGYRMPARRLRALSRHPLHSKTHVLNACEEKRGVIVTIRLIDALLKMN